MRFAISSLGLCLLISLIGTGTAGARRPPTPDPTYGLPIPKSVRFTDSTQQPVKWIWTNHVADNQTIYARRTFTLERVPQKAVLYITADDFFTLYVNGQELDHSAPQSGNGFVWRQVHAVLLTPHLHAGKNVIAVRILNAGGPAGLIGMLMADNKSILRTDKSWRATEQGDLPSDWIDTGYDDSSWPYATEEASLGDAPWNELNGWPGYSSDVQYLAHLTLPVVGVLDVQPGAGSLHVDASHPGHLQVVAPPQDSGRTPPSLVVDFGKEVAGRVRLIVKGDGIIQVSTGESEDEAVMNPWGGIHTFDSRTMASPLYTPYSAFHYAKITFYAPPGASDTPLTVDVSLDFKYYPVQYKGSFDCSDPLLTRIWYVGAYTAHLCMQEDIWDAPKRDRARWMGDLQVSGRVIDTVFADKFLMEQTMQRLRDDAQGGNPPADLPKSHVNGIPGYSAAWVVGLTDFYKHIGDKTYLMKQHDLLASMIAYMEGDLDDDGLFANKHGAWDYVDWSPDFNGDSPLARIATQMYYIKAAKDAAFLFQEMGDAANAEHCRQLAERLTQAAQQHWLSPQTDTFGLRRQENAMAIFAGATTPKETAAIYKAVFAPDSPAWSYIATPYYNNYVIYAMSLAGHTHAALDFIRRFWGGMIAEGATTFWEGYDPSWPKKHFHLYLQADNGMGTFVSLCHGWSSGPTSFLTECVLGVRPTGAGYSTAVIAPDLAGLQWAEGNVPTPHGLIHIRVEALKKGGERIDVTLPSDVKADVQLPGKARLMGSSLHPQFQADENLSHFTLDRPGHYVFEASAG